MPALLAAVALAGCASTHGLAPESAPGDPDRLAVSRTFDGALSEAAWPSATWWTALGDPQLDTLMVDALRDSPTLAAAQARVRKAQAQAGLAEEARKPGMRGSAQYSGAYLPESLIPEDIGGGEYKGLSLLTLSFEYDPDPWGGKRARWEAAVDQLHAAEVDAQQARLMLAGNLARTYIALAQAHDLVDAAEREQQRANDLLALARRRASAGLDNTLNQRQAESALATARQQADAGRQRIDALRNALAALAGQGPDRGIALQAPHLRRPADAALPSILPSELLGHRPDVVAARWRVEAAARGIDASKAEFYPNVNLTAMVGLVAGSLGDLFDSKSLLGTGGPAISLPIFQGRRLREQLAGSNADYDLAVAQYEQTVLAAVRDVADALQSARALDTQIASTRQARDAAVHARDVLASRQRAGLGTRIDVLGAERPVLQLDQQLATLRAQRMTAAADLVIALGGGTAPVSPSLSSVSESP